ncbi:cystatin family protein [Flavobacterium aurantiibacter]|uniref:Uncharacterized protein n=1 Tax=Flavobacterium aurantiibacter TaxID=2023067 RepID=A0A256AEA6_9FLAO|nr:hypothetical protein [Flavobacterium aurantiibacter]OYQ51998.1 hypothetical protein CHX27_00115 [Flavobacterium aurantiibacter]
MKASIFIGSFLFVFNCFSQEKSTAFFSKLNITILAGDEMYLYKEMDFESRGDKIVGRMLKPAYFVGRDALPVDDIELNDKAIKTLKLFIERASSLETAPLNDSISSSYRQDYTISVDGKVLSVSGYRDWKGVSYDEIEQLIFSEYFEKLEAKRLALQKQTVKKLFGFWKPIQNIDSLKSNQIYRFAKVKRNKKDKHYWYFGKKGRYRNAALIPFGVNYHVNVEETFSIFIEPDYTKSEFEAEHLSSAYMEIISISTSELVIKYRWP